MTPETEGLLQQCRTAQLQHTDEQLSTWLGHWFELLIGDESVEEELDDLCLLLDYRVKSWGTKEGRKKTDHQEAYHLTVRQFTPVFLADGAIALLCSHRCAVAPFSSSPPRCGARMLMSSEALSARASPARAITV